MSVEGPEPEPAQAEPPSFEEAHASDGQNANDAGAPDASLPSYSRPSHRGSTARAERTEHQYSLQNNKGKEWLSLKVLSGAPSAKLLPLYLEGEKIEGVVSVDIDKAENSKGITITASADNTVVGQEPLVFLDLTQTLWEPTGSEKLSGKRSWPFSITLPQKVSVSEIPKGQEKPYPLPPTFSERAGAAYIDYKLTVTAKRGLFKVNQTLATSFVYSPRIPAPRPSLLREAAYEEGSVLIGPEGDPDGWQTLSPLKVTGKLFDVKSVEFQCTLSLAAPLLYAITSHIPLILTLQCDDPQALDLLSLPSSISVSLMRTISVGSGATEEKAIRRSNNTFNENVCRAYFWPSVIDGNKDPTKRRLQGEIELRGQLKPSFVFPRFSVRYNVCLYPFSATGFSASTPADEPILLQSVTVVTENPPGVKPHSHAPPGYVRNDQADYNNSVGYLENGNQRFYHHTGHT